MTEFVGHIRDDGTKQSLLDHLEGTAKLCSEFASKIGCENLGFLMGLLHDQGKYTQWFTEYIRSSHEGNHSQKKRNHSSAGAQHITQLCKDSKNLAEEITAKLIAEAVCCHHSGLCDNLTPLGEDAYDVRIYPNTPISYEETLQNFQTELESKYNIYELFEKAVSEVEQVIRRMREAKLDPGFSLGMLQKYLFSCLIDADRLDTATFMQGKSHPQKQDTLSLWNSFAEILDKKLDGFPQDSALNKLRAQISLECKTAASREPGIYTLNCPTGSGKTLASMRYALYHAKKYGKERIFYIIPFTTIIDQNADSIRENLKDGKNDDFVNCSVLEIHSALVHSKEQGKEEEASERELMTERMDALIVLTTMVRFLETFFGGGTQRPRTIHQFANSVILFDEIQTIPIQCISLFNYAINFLVKVCGATVILCTATQPLLHQTQKPIMLSESPDLVHISSEMNEQFKRVQVVSKCKIGKYQPHEVADLIMETACKERTVLTIMNTKSSARQVFEAVAEKNAELPKEEQFQLYFLTTGFCPQHRREILSEITKKLDPKKNERIICVTTQLIEAGVDVSFHAVLRAIAGLDSIIQAAGRCNRHGEDKMLKTVTIFNPGFEDLSKLRDIKKGIEATERVLQHFDDLLSPEAIKKYFEYYFAQRQSEMDYPVEIQEKNTTIRKNLFELLSSNKDAYAAYYHNNQKWYPSLIVQSFETAGQVFRAIDDNTLSIIVPYKNGKEIIAKLQSDCSLEEKISLLKQAQQYSVNLFFYEREKLKNAISEINDMGVFVLADSYYSEETGVCFEAPKIGAMIM